MYDFRLNPDMNALIGCGLGGTSLINANISLQPDSAVLSNPHWPETVRQESAQGKLSLYFDRAVNMLGANRYPNDAPVTEKLTGELLAVPRFSCARATPDCGCRQPWQAFLGQWRHGRLLL